MDRRSFLTGMTGAFALLTSGNTLAKAIPTEATPIAAPEIIEQPERISASATDWTRNRRDHEVFALLCDGYLVHQPKGSFMQAYDPKGSSIPAEFTRYTPHGMKIRWVLPGMTNTLVLYNAEVIIVDGVVVKNRGRGLLRRYVTEHSGLQHFLLKNDRRNYRIAQPVKAA